MQWFKALVVPIIRSHFKFLQSHLLTLGKSLQFCSPHFPHLDNGRNSRSHVIECVRHSALCLGQVLSTQWLGWYGRIWIVSEGEGARWWMLMRVRGVFLYLLVTIPWSSHGKPHLPALLGADHTPPPSRLGHLTLDGRIRAPDPSQSAWSQPSSLGFLQGWMGTWS